MRLLPLCFLLPTLACSFDGPGSSSSAGNESPTETFSQQPSTVDPVYTALFDVDATIPADGGLGGLWQSVQLGSFAGAEVTVRVRFTGNTMLVAVRFSDATFGVSSSYQQGTGSPSELPLTIGQSMTVTGHDQTRRAITVAISSGSKSVRQNTVGTSMYRATLGNLYKLTFLSDGAVPNDFPDEDASFEKIGD